MLVKYLHILNLFQLQQEAIRSDLLHRNRQTRSDGDNIRRSLTPKRPILDTRLSTKAGHNIAYSDLTIIGRWSKKKEEGSSSFDGGGPDEYRGISPRLTRRVRKVPLKKDSLLNPWRFFANRFPPSTSVYSLLLSHSISFPRQKSIMGTTGREGHTTGGGGQQRTQFQWNSNFRFHSAVRLQGPFHELYNNVLGFRNDKSS